MVSCLCFWLFAFRYVNADVPLLAAAQVFAQTDQKLPYERIFRSMHFKLVEAGMWSFSRVVCIVFICVYVGRIFTLLSPFARHTAASEWVFTSEFFGATEVFHAVFAEPVTLFEVRRAK